MSFLQPLLLWALPLIALPIIIHLIHQRRFQTVQWAAMAFLLAATKMSKGYARLRQWLILAARTLAIAGLIFAISRPLSSGWLGLAAGGRVDTTIILLDRSASMSQIGAGGRTKLQAGIKRLQDSLGKLESAHYVLIDSVGMKAIELASADQLFDLAEYGGATATAQIPEMLELADDYLRDHQPSRTEIWICSDHRFADWDPASGRWQALRDAIGNRTQVVRFHSLAFSERSIGNHRLSGQQVRRVEKDGRAELLLSFRVDNQEAQRDSERIALQLELNGATSEIEFDMTGASLDVVDYAIEIEADNESGWGRLSLPKDVNEHDNHFYFTYQTEPLRETLIVADVQEEIRPLEFAASVAADRATSVQTTLCSVSELVAFEYQRFSLVIWQSDLPAADSAEQRWLEAYARRGGAVIFFPSDTPLSDASDNEFASIRWGQWSDQAGNVTTWEIEQDLLGKTLSGESLPVGEVRAERFRGIEGEFTTLANLSQGEPFLVKSVQGDGEVYFCSTTVDPLDSNLASRGVVIFAMIQRAMEKGARSLGRCRSTEASAIPLSVQWPAEAGSQEVEWIRVDGAEGVLSTEYSSHAGIYRSADRLFAVNRSVFEDDPRLVSDQQLEELFEGLSFRTVQDEVGVESSLIQEIWRVFLMLMLLMLLAESALSLPRKQQTQSDLLSGDLFQSGASAR